MSWAELLCLHRQLSQWEKFQVEISRKQKYPIKPQILTVRVFISMINSPKDVGFRIEKVLGLTTNLKDGHRWAVY
jgi:hypothetical protein